LATYLHTNNITFERKTHAQKKKWVGAGRDKAARNAPPQTLSKRDALFHVYFQAAVAGNSGDGASALLQRAVRRSQLRAQPADCHNLSAIGTICHRLSQCVTQRGGASHEPQVVTSAAYEAFQDEISHTSPVAAVAFFVGFHVAHDTAEQGCKHLFLGCHACGVRRRSVDDASDV
jgi:hypothetical protein